MSISASVLGIVTAGWAFGLSGSGAPALAPLLRPAVPEFDKFDKKDARSNPIDAFVHAGLAAGGLKSADEADRATLIRRVTFDLTGLPPTPEEIAAFVDDEDPLAYEAVVDRLLQSPAFGERFGRAWLDVARFTESQGFEYDRLRDRAWPYRDWVVGAMNADLPYDEFMKLQIAGDVTAPVTRDGIVATAFLVCGPWDEAGNSQANETQKAITRQDEIEDLLGAVGQGFLGMTVNCARCHDHKFDPIPRTDYYRLASVFAGVRHGERPLLGPEDIERRNRSLAALQQSIVAAEHELAALMTRGETRVRASASGARATSTRALVPPPVALARWRFDLSCRDENGALNGELRGAARIDGGRLVLDGADACVVTAPLARDLREKTLEAFVALSTLEQGGGAPISIESGDGQTFDAIVFGEREPRKWIAGSNGFARTRDLDAPQESAGPGEWVHVAVVYDETGGITVYRNGALYGHDSGSGMPPVTFRASDAHLLFGMRHHGGANAFLRGSIEEAALYDRALSQDEVKASFESAGSGVTEEDAIAALTPSERQDRARIQSELAALRDEEKAIPPLETAYVGRREQPVKTRELRRGDVTTPGEVVAPGALSCVSTLDPDFHLAADSPEAARRITFASWLADSRNPLPYRVIVNRIWAWHFGHGLVATPSDLGVNSGVPSHPELLDWLASELIASGFHLKSIHRLIVTSATYRQSSRGDSVAYDQDAEDRLLWRFPPRRIDAEMVRDTILAVSGALDRRLGGPSFRPFLELPFPANSYPPIDDDRDLFHRRSLYRMNVNSGKDALLDVFDCPDPAIKTPVRGRTTTPLQALVMMNDPFVLRESRRFAARALLDEHGDLPAATVRAFWLAFGRAPSPDEAEQARALAQAHGLETLTWSLFNASEFVDVR